MAAAHTVNFRPGLEVSLVGLKNASLKGAKGNLIAFEGASGRWNVRLSGPRSGTVVAVLPKNLTDGTAFSSELQSQLRAALQEGFSGIPGVESWGAGVPPATAATAHATFKAAAELYSASLASAEKLAADAPKRRQGEFEGFGVGCDFVLCTSGVAWAGPARSSVISCCGRCVEARYCSTTCQSFAWRGQPLAAIDVANSREAMWRAFLSEGHDTTSIAYKLHGPLTARDVSPAAKAEFLARMPSTTAGIHSHVQSCFPLHKAWCGKLRMATRPLRLITPFTRQGWDKMGQRSFLLTRGMFTPFADDVFSSVAQYPTPSSLVVDCSPPMCCSVLDSGTADSATATRLQAVLQRLSPQRLILAVPKCWATNESDATTKEAHGVPLPPSVALFEVELDSCDGRRLDGAALAAAAVDAMRFIFAEEDRVATGVRYETGGVIHLGMAMPPRYARLTGVTLDEGQKVSRLAVPTDPVAAALGDWVLQLAPSRLRWATNGPFGIGEMACEDLSLCSLAFHHPPDWPAGWFTVYASFTATVNSQWLPST